MPTYQTTLEIEVEVLIAEDIVLSCTVPVECYHWDNSEIDPERYDSETSYTVDKYFVEPEWFHVRFRDIAIASAEEQFKRDIYKYEE